LPLPAADVALLTETVQKLDENHFAGDDLFGRIVARNCGGSLMEIVARVEEGDPIARVRKNPLHQEVF
jgi:hypothetical protein